MQKNDSKNNAKNTGKDMTKDKPLDKKVKKLMEQDRAEKARLKHLKINFRENRFGPLIFAVLFAGLGAIFIFNSSAASQKTASAGTARMWLVTAAPQATRGSTVTTEIWVDSAAEPVNAVQADLTYPPDRLSYAGVDTADSGFGVTAETTGAAGKVLVVRGNTAPLTGKQLVGRVNFVAQATGPAKVDIDKQSQLLRSADNKNILSSLAGVQYKVTN